jgi:hypothetical protein
VALAAVPTVASASIGLGVVASFAPSVNGEVWAMASDGASLWIGGTFTSVNGVARRGVAKLNPTTGAVDAPSTPSSPPARSPSSP